MSQPTPRCGCRTPHPDAGVTAHSLILPKSFLILDAHFPFLYVTVISLVLKQNWCLGSVIPAHYFVKPASFTMYLKCLIRLPVPLLVMPSSAHLNTGLYEYGFSLIHWALFWSGDLRRPCWFSGAEDLLIILDNVAATQPSFGPEYIYCVPLSQHSYGLPGKTFCFQLPPSYGAAWLLRLAFLCLWWAFSHDFFPRSLSAVFFPLVLRGLRGWRLRNVKRSRRLHGVAGGSTRTVPYGEGQTGAETEDHSGQG